MKLTLIGRPLNWTIEGNLVTFALIGKAPGSFPNGLPPLPKGPPTTWTVYLSMKQWHRVYPSLRQDKTDVLILDGYPALVDGEPRLWVQGCLSMAMQRERQAAQRAASAAAQEVPA